MSALNLLEVCFMIAIYKRLLGFSIIVCIILLQLYLFGVKTAVFAKGSQADADAKVLYSRINKFLDDNKDCPPENFDQICSNYILNSSKPLKFGKKDMLETKTKPGTAIYRGVSDKMFAQEMKNGKIYIASGVKNVRGSGIYTTPDFACASRYATSRGEVLTMFLDPTAKILENSYLEQLKQKVISMDPQRFTFSHKNSMYDSMEAWIKEQFRLYLKEDYDKFLRGEICDWNLLDSILEQMKKHPDYPILAKSRKRYYFNKVAAVLSNSGLLAKFLGYDVLHSKDFLWDKEEEEYLVLDAGVLTLLK